MTSITKNIERGKHPLNLTQLMKLKQRYKFEQSSKHGERRSIKRLNRDKTKKRQTQDIHSLLNLFKLEFS